MVLEKISDLIIKLPACNFDLNKSPGAKPGDVPVYPGFLNNPPAEYLLDVLTLFIIYQ